MSMNKPGTGGQDQRGTGVLDEEKKRAERLGIRVLDFPMGSILGQRFGADYERNSRAAAMLSRNIAVICRG